jgi:hypothetical protein
MREFLKQAIAIFLSLSLAMPVYATDDFEREAPDLGANLIANESDAFNRLKLSNPAVATYSTTVQHEGKILEVSVARGEVAGHEINKVIKIFKMMEPDIRKAHALDPNTKFQFFHITDTRHENAQYLAATEILDFLKTIDAGTSGETVRIDNNVVDKFKKAFGSIFDQTSTSDIYWGMLRLAGSGTSSTFSFFVAGFPIPVSLIVGAAVTGGSSATIGILIEKFTGWLDNNKVDPNNKMNRIGSIETYMLLSPVLIPLSAYGINNVESAMLLAGTATLSVLVQNIYFMVKKRSPNAAMWYKWLATEVLFVTVPTVALNLMGYQATDVVAAVMTAFKSGTLGTLAQGVWEIFLTKVRKPFLEAAILKDLAEMSERFNGRRVFSLSRQEMQGIKTMEELKAKLGGKNILDISESEYKAIAHKAENEVRARFKKYFYFASLWSVASAMAMTAGGYSGNSALYYTGMAGIFMLGLSGAGTWLKVHLKNKRIKAKEGAAPVVVEAETKSSFVDEGKPTFCRTAF